MPTRRPFQFGCLGAGLLMIVVGLGALTWAWRGGRGPDVAWPGLRELLSSNTARAAGVVVRSGSYGMPASTGGVYPIVRFEVQGKAYEFKGIASSAGTLTPGTQVTVVYRTDDPTQAHIRGLREMLPMLSLIGTGLILLVSGLVAAAYGSRRGA